MGAFIPDGHTCDGYLAEMPQFDCEAIKFKFRPAGASKAITFTQHRTAITGEERAKRDAEFLATNLVEWDLKYDEKPIEITASNCGKLHMEVQKELIDIICRYRKSDAMPNGTRPETVNPDQSLGNS